MLLFNISVSGSFLLLGFLLAGGPPFYFALTFVLLTLFVMTSLVMGGYVSGVLPLVLVTVYIGAMMVMVGYVCSVTPNPSPVRSSRKLLLTSGLLPLSLLSGMGPYYTPFVSENLPPLSEFYYSFLGLHLFMYICLLLLVLLVVVSTSTSLVKSPLRSITP